MTVHVASIEISDKVPTEEDKQKLYDLFIKVGFFKEQVKISVRFITCPFQWVLDGEAERIDE